jgi:hypothetical protein
MELEHENEITLEMVSSAIIKWINHFQATLFEGTTEHEVAHILGSGVRDKAWIYHGGSGRRSRLYMIDDYVQARFDFDDQDLVVAYAVFAQKGGWLRGPGGALLYSPEPADIELWVPQPKS